MAHPWRLTVSHGVDLVNVIATRNRSKMPLSRSALTECTRRDDNHALLSSFSPMDKVTYGQDRTAVRVDCRRSHSLESKYRNDKYDEADNNHHGDDNPHLRLGQASKETDTDEIAVHAFRRSHTCGVLEHAVFVQMIENWKALVARQLQIPADRIIR